MLNPLQDLCNEVPLLFLIPKGVKVLQNSSDLSGYSPLHVKLRQIIIALLSYNIILKNRLMH